MDLPRTRYARVGDARIAYQAIGEGPPDLLFVPGFVSNLEVTWEHPPYERFMERLSRIARVIPFDKRGSGLSDPLVGRPSLEQRIDDIRAVMDAAGSERATVMGISEGAPMAALFAAMHPDRVERAVLYGGFARGTPADDYPWGFDEETWETMLDAVDEAWGDAVSLFVIAPSRRDDEPFRRWFGRFERMTGGPGAVVAALRLDMEIDIRDVLPSVRVPTLVVHRSNDVWPVGAAQYIAEQIPDSRLVELPGEDHWPWIGDPDAIVDAVVEFMTGERAERDPDRVLATVLFTDIVASTKRAAELGDQAWREVLQQHEAITRRWLERFRGRVVKSTGDGVLATFDGPARAVRCARSLADDVRDLGIQIRAGLHAGECELLNGDVGGIAVHTGARVMSLAGPDEVLVSSTVKDLVAGAGITFEDRGSHELKGVPGEWRVFAVADC